MEKQRMFADLSSSMPSLPGAKIGKSVGCRLLLQRMITDRPQDVRDLYWQAAPARPNQSGGQAEVGLGGLMMQPNTVLSFNTYFNAFFETLWRRHTRLETLTLRIRIEGPCTVRVHRRVGGAVRLAYERMFETGGAVTITLPDPGGNFRRHGLLALELATGEQPAAFLEGGWFAEGADPATVRLSAVFCTFNRERELGRILDEIAADPAVAQCLARVFVVNQGHPDLAAAPSVKDAAFQLGDRLRVVEQDNFGGAGGFGRGLLEALDDPAMTHAVLLDDDIALEPDSLLRMAAFFTLARTDILIGGHMLDSMQPTMLYEAGAVISERHWTFQPQHHSRNLADGEVLEALGHPIAVHYSGWWCCGIPLSVVRRHGMPLPCFIRGDDMEYGLRLHQAGVATVAMPGIAVWHEPFYLKIGGWHLYYETRNMLIAASLHQPIERWQVTRRMARHLAMSLLTFRYYDAALILQGIRDYLAGPMLLETPPQPLHAGLDLLRKRYPGAKTARSIVLEPQSLDRAPSTTTAFLLTLARLVLRNAVTPTRAAPPRLLPVRDWAWQRMGGVEHVAVETWWDDDLPTFQRSRERFRTLAAEATRLLLRLYREAPSQARRWQTALPRLTSQAFWRQYLNIPARAKADKQAALSHER